MHQYALKLMRNSFSAWRNWLIESLQQDIDSKVIVRMKLREKQLQEHYHEIIQNLKQDLEKTRLP